MSIFQRVPADTRFGRSGFIEVDYLHPHTQRARQILAKYPEVRSLFGNTPSTALYAVGLVALQFAVAYLLREQSIWLNLVVAYTVGAIANHGLWVLIHDATHNLIFRGSTANKVMQIVANFPIVFPSAITFRNYHLVHHRHQGELGYEPDLAIDIETKLAGRSALGKAAWLVLFFLFQPFRVRQLRIQFFDRWIVANILAEIAVLAAFTWFAGPYALLYLVLSSLFSIGLHPVGARWIQEHYIIKPDQETYSYYGPLNRLSFNIGHHNEHHDLMMVPWSKLPKLKRMAPEFYDSLYSHKSWTGLLLKFLFDPELHLQSRIVRKPRHAPRDEKRSEMEISHAEPAPGSA